METCFKAVRADVLKSLAAQEQPLRDRARDHRQALQARRAGLRGADHLRGPRLLARARRSPGGTASRPSGRSSSTGSSTDASSVAGRPIRLSLGLRLSARPAKEMTSSRCPRSRGCAPRRREHAESSPRRVAAGPEPARARRARQAARLEARLFRRLFAYTRPYRGRLLACPGSPPPATRPRAPCSPTQVKPIFDEVLIRGRERRPARRVTILVLYLVKGICVLLLDDARRRGGAARGHRPAQRPLRARPEAVVRVPRPRAPRAR